MFNKSRKSGHGGVRTGKRSPNFRVLVLLPIILPIPSGRLFLPFNSPR